MRKMKNKKDSFLLEKETWERKMKNKKGSEGTTWTIIVIILALIVLVVLVVGFTSGWSNLWEKMKAFFGWGSNVDTVVQACEISCTTGAKYSYCSENRTLRWDVNGKLTEAKVTCNEVVTKVPSVALSCPDIDCST